MRNILSDLYSKKLINPPKWMLNNVCYLTIGGSFSYGVSSETSDCDILGFAIPPRDVVFPHEAGVIQGFDLDYEKFDQWAEHHVKDHGAEKEYDLNVYGIVKYFRLLANGNINLLDTLFSSRNCVIYINAIGERVKENRKIFLSKRVFHSCRGYAYEQLTAIRKNKHTENSKRWELRQKYGFDVKFALHCVRLLNEAEQMLATGDLDLMRDRNILMAIRNGEWTLAQIEDYFQTKEKQLEILYAESNALPYAVREAEIKQLLVDCLEHHYGSLGAVYQSVDKKDQAIKDIKKILDDVL